jgi:hypothetical protein
MNYKKKKKEVLMKTSEHKKTEVGYLGYHVVSWGRVRLSPLGTSATTWPIAPAPDDKMMMNVEQSVE